MGVGYDMNDFLKYVDAALPPKEARQFRKAIEHPMREFHKRVIAPQFFQPTQNLYLGVALDKFARGKNHCVAQAMLDHDNLWQALTYFTNPLEIPRLRSSWMAKKYGSLRRIVSHWGNFMS
jgi:hypothetical protein